MIRLFKNIFLLFFLFFSSLYASQKEADNIASISAVSLYNINKTALQETVKAYIRSDKSLKALRIVESLSNETYINVYKENGKVIFNKPFPEGVNQFKLYTAISSFENEEVGTIYAYYEKVKSKNLNEEEISWLKKNQVIKIAVVKDYEPYDMVDENNKLYGFHSSIAKLINEKLGTNIVLIPFNSWKDAYTAAFTGELNGIFGLSWSKEREEEYFIYSPTYHFTPYHLLIHENTKDINTLSFYLCTLY